MAAAKPRATRSEPASADISIVRLPFIIEVDGEPIAYRKGEPVEPGDPVLKRMTAEYFEPLVFPHPVRRARMRSPEPRA